DLRLDLLPRRLLDFALRLSLGDLATAALALELVSLFDERVPLAQQAVHAAEGVDHGARELGFLFLGELLFVDVDDLFDRDVTVAQKLAQLPEALEGEVRAENGDRDLVLTLFDALGERDLALTCEQGDASHLAQVEPHGVLGAADGTRGEVDRLRGAIVVVVGRGLLAVSTNLGRQAARLGGVHHLHVHGAEHHHDVVELVERHDVRRKGVVHLIIGEEALLLAHRDEPIELLQLRFFTHALELLAGLRGPWDAEGRRRDRRPARYHLDTRTLGRCLAARRGDRPRARRAPPVTTGSPRSID